jgi:hypothetical protein
MVLTYSGERLFMIGWQITAKTIYCDSVDDEVTLLVNMDHTASCTGCKKYSEPNDITRRMIKEKSKRLKRPIQCGGEDCIRITEYKQKIFAEENK